MKQLTECDACKCRDCMKQPACEKSCELCKKIPGRVSYCKNECRYEQISLFGEIKRFDDGKKKIK